MATGTTCLDFLRFIALNMLCFNEAPSRETIQNEWVSAQPNFGPRISDDPHAAATSQLTRYQRSGFYAYPRGKEQLLLFTTEGLALLAKHGVVPDQMPKRFRNRSIGKDRGARIDYLRKNFSVSNPDEYRKTGKAVHVTPARLEKDKKADTTPKAPASGTRAEARQRYAVTYAGKHIETTGSRLDDLRAIFICHTELQHPPTPEQLYRARGVNDANVAGNRMRTLRNVGLLDFPDQSPNENSITDLGMAFLDEHGLGDPEWVDLTRQIFEVTEFPLFPSEPVQAKPAPPQVRKAIRKPKPTAVKASGPLSEIPAEAFAPVEAKPVFNGNADVARAKLERVQTRLYELEAEVPDRGLDAMAGQIGYVINMID